MRYFFLVLTLTVFGACGGNGGAVATTTTTTGTLTAQELVDNCLTGDLQDLSSLLAILQNLLNSEAGAPTPEFDLLSALLTGIVPYTLDLDGDDNPEVSGTVHFTDTNGNVTIPVNDLNSLINGGLGDLADILAQVPAGTDFHLSFNFSGPLAGATNSGSGSFVFDLGDGTLENLSVSGDGRFTAGDCVFDFDFSDVEASILNGEFPVASLDFDLAVGADLLAGAIALDGSSQARIEAALNGGANEVFVLDLAGLGSSG